MTGKIWWCDACGLSQTDRYGKTCTRCKWTPGAPKPESIFTDERCRYCGFWHITNQRVCCSDASGHAAHERREAGTACESCRGYGRRPTAGVVGVCTECEGSGTPAASQRKPEETP